MSYGTLPMQHVQNLIDGQFILNAKPENIRTGSLNLIPTDEFWRVRGVFLPGHKESVFSALKRVGAVKIPSNSILERGACYVCKLNESVAHLPTDVYGYSNPKSSSGRLNLHIRMLVDGVSRYDSVPKGYEGPLWLLITPKTFSVVAPVGISLSQVRFFNQDTRLDRLGLESVFERDGGFLCDSTGRMIRSRQIFHSDNDGSLILTLGLDFEFPGFEAIPTGEEINLRELGHYDPERFFRPVTVTNNSLSLAANTFYILSTAEYVRVPVKFACEMAPMDERSGDLRSHYAGFIDSGWGIGEDGQAKGQPLTLEVRSFDNGLIIRNGQPIAKVKYEKMIDPPTLHYGQMSPNYGRQFGPALSKHFKPWESR